MFVVSDYKRMTNEVGGQETTAPKEVHQQMKALLGESDELKMFYYRGLSEWGHINWCLMDTVLAVGSWFYQKKRK
ncbi:MAG: hypothetical protein IKI44_00090 [Bacteroidaceae bacterium]|nr:hypothetical protein [Bacteroidaceae bacterium]